MSAPQKVRAIAFLLPQFHPIPENDRWWGRGFTEWTNVTKARSLFEGHYQPHLPADLGFYDLRLPESRAAQAALAKEYGIHGFCYYHYWFNGRRLLERPVNEIVASGQPDFPFCLCWANENWTRRWDGQEQDVLMEQRYTADDDIEHIRTLLPIFKDPRYIKVRGRPLFLTYRLSRLPDPVATLHRWRREAEKAGLPGLYFCNVECMPSEHGLAPKTGLDAAVEFAPDWDQLPPSLNLTRRTFVFRRRRSISNAYLENTVCDYGMLAERMLGKAQPDYLRFPGVTPMWDNSPRRARSAFILQHSTPELYGQWLRRTIDRFAAPSTEENFVFINAWNEWAEGNHLEPCQRWGLRYLEATRDALIA